MVGHQDIGTNLPMRGGAPDFDQRFVNWRIGQPRTAPLCANGKKNQGWGAIVFDDSFDRVSSLRQHFTIITYKHNVVSYLIQTVPRYAGNNTKAPARRRFGLVSSKARPIRELRR